MLRVSEFFFFVVWMHLQLRVVVFWIYEDQQTMGKTAKFLLHAQTFEPVPS
jgi:hypothetical protein